MVPGYITAFYDRYLADLDLSGLRVLEIGCGYASLMRLVLTNNVDITELIGINYPGVDVPSPGLNARIMTMDATTLDFDDGAFDLVYSLATFEHVPDLAATLHEVERVLAPGGCLVAKWSPIWSGFDGHHYGPSISHRTHSPIELPWAHLMFEPDEFAAYLVRGEGFTAGEADEACVRIYDSPWLNRLRFQDYSDIIEATGLTAVALTAPRCEAGDLLARVGRKVTDGSIDAGRVLDFFRRSDESMLVYKLAMTLQKQGSAGLLPRGPRRTTPPGRAPRAASC